MKRCLLLHAVVCCAAAYFTLGFNVRAQVDGPVDSYRSVPGLVGWFQFNEKGDTVVNRVDGMPCVVHGTTSVKGYVGNGRSFDGVHDWMNCGESFDLAGGDFTIAVWLYPRSDADWGTIVTKGASSYDFGSYYFAVGPTGVRFVINNVPGAGWYGIEGTNAPLALNTWQHVAATFHRTDSGEQLTVYVNGEVWDTAFTTRGIRRSSEDFEVGGYHAFGSTYPYANYNGIMDELLLFDRSLSQEEIQHVAGPNHGSGH